jgi:hypothetical protein
MFELPEERVAEVVARGDGRIYLVSHSGRIAVPAFAAAIEWYWYPPDSSRNRLFDVYGTDWFGLGWVITAFPSGRFAAVRRLAKQLGLRIADGAPTVVGNKHGAILMQFTSRPSKMRGAMPPDFPHDALRYFPGAILPNGRENDCLFTVEYDRDSPLYKNKKNDEDAMMQASAEINEAFNRGVRLTPAQIADYIYGSGSFPHPD